MQITTAIACRSPTFLARDEWKTIPWSTSSTSKDLVQHLLDDLADIPTLLAQYDSLVEATKANSLPLSEVLDRRTRFQRSVADIEHRLHQWKREYADPVGRPFEVPYQVEALGGPRDPSNSDSQFPSSDVEIYQAGHSFLHLPSLTLNPNLHVLCAFTMPLYLRFHLLISGRKVACYLMSDTT
jgi:hypothetical protein